ncbi:MAG: hypothetical protein IPK83_03590 [Planctomycetes bacterium]|nr:hypothetical protein [Planctomycetota bacterium]
MLTTTINLLQAVTEQEIKRMIYVGSSDEPTGSADEIVPTSPYGAAKFAGCVFTHVPLPV